MPDTPSSPLRGTPMADTSSSPLRGAPMADTPSSSPPAAPPDLAAVPAVDIRGLCFSYGDAPVLKDVSLTLVPGEFLAVIGPNGGGKTTLLQCLLGLLKPGAGSVRIFNGEPARMRSHIGYVPQFSTLRAGFPASVLETVLMGAARPSLRGGSWHQDRPAREKALAYLETLGLADYAGRSVDSLSGGQRQRVLVARALMGKPEEDGDPASFLLLLDEPTANIDPEGAFCFYEFLGKLRGSISLIAVSHDLFMISPFFSSVAAVNTSLTRLPCSELNAENLTIIFGRHLHDCPVGDFQHAGQALHASGCTHPACSSPAPSPDHNTPPTQSGA